MEWVIKHLQKEYGKQWGKLSAEHQIQAATIFLNNPQRAKSFIRKNH